MGYHVQKDADVTHKDVNIFCNTNQFPSFPFCCPHTKPHGVIGFSKHYNIQFDPKQGHGICEILQITCSCVEFKSMSYTPWNPSFTPQQQRHYQPVIYLAYWQVVG